jgi:hypothetical protein
MSSPTHQNGAAPVDPDTLAATEQMHDAYAGSAPRYVQASARRVSGEKIVAHYRQLLEIACYQEQVAEQVAGQHRHESRLGSHAAVVVVALTGLAETALAYFGLTLAVPSLFQAGESGLLSLIAQQGALLAAIAIGVISTVVTTAVGRQLSSAHRGLIAEPSSHASRPETST